MEKVRSLAKDEATSDYFGLTLGVAKSVECIYLLCADYGSLDGKALGTPYGGKDDNTLGSDNGPSLVLSLDKLEGVENVFPLGTNDILFDGSTWSSRLTISE